LALTLKKAKETKEPNAIKTGILQGSHYLTWIYKKNALWTYFGL
jgi:hypothetical protein